VKKLHRLKARGDFQRLLSGRRVFAGKSMVAFAAPGRTDRTRVGVTASRLIRGSVAKNRARRRLREAARQALLGEDSKGAGTGIPFDVVLIARPGALTLPFPLLGAEVGELASRLDREG
jgi:ribonuclease P protein component